MLPTKIYPLIIAANASMRLMVQGQYFKILSSTGAVNVVSTFGKMEGLVAGQGLENTPFNDLTLTDVSGGPNTIRILIGDENFIDGLNGSIEVNKTTTAQSAVFANSVATVTNASAQLVGINALRKFLMIQNKDATGSVFLNFGAAAATVANGLLLVPGANLELSNCVTTQQIQAIGSIANNPNIVIVEG